MRSTRHFRSMYQDGFSLISAIFLLVVLAALGVAMVTISTTQHQSSALDIQGVRAYQAARAGIEWGLYKYLQPPPLGSGCGGFSANPSNVAMPAGTSLSDFTVTVTCTPTALGIISTAVIHATACNIPAGGSCPNATPNSSNYVQRVLEVRL